MKKLIVILMLFTIGYTETIEQKYAQSLTRELRKDEQIKFLVKENNENGFWKTIYMIGTIVVSTLYITK